MRDRFRNGEIRDLSEFKQLLQDNNRDKAYYKILKNQAIFERAMNDCLVERESNLEHRDLIEVFKDYIKEHPRPENLFKIIKKN